MQLCASSCSYAGSEMNRDMACNEGDEFCIAQDVLPEQAAQNADGVTDSCITAQQITSTTQCVLVLERITSTMQIPVYNC